MLVVGTLVLPVLHNPVVILVVALGTYGLTLERDRSRLVRLGVVGSVTLAFIVWAASQPGYY